MRQGQFPQGKNEWRDLPVQIDHERLEIGKFQVMQRWEEPLMLAMAEEVMSHGGGHILEVGFGMGISAGMVMQKGPKSYTVIEAHPEIAARARAWGVDQPAPVTVHEGFFQDVAPTLAERFDGILFDPYPVTEDEWHNYHLDFIPIARDLLRPGGTFVYFSGQTIRFSEEHSQALLNEFADVRLFRVDGLKPPDDCEYWDYDHMVLASARRSRG